MQTAFCIYDSATLSAIVCGQPANGTNTAPVPVLPESERVYLALFNYSCIIGYEAEDGLSVTCDALGNWQPPPTCEGIK